MFLRLILMFSFFGTTCLGIVFTGRTAHAQVVSNQPSTLVNSTPFGHVILGGNSQGQNLFHSFSQMDTRNGQFVNFIANPAITNVIGRITDSPTVLNGLVTVTLDGRTLAPGINLFLLSPQGISFGPKAITNIDGAFVATTASGMTFADGTAFSAETAAPATLTISTPVGLQLNNNPAAIQVQGINNNLPSFGLNSLRHAQNILLIGGDVNLAGGGITLLSGRLQIAGLAEAGTVSLATNASGFLSAALPAGVLRADVTLSNNMQVAASGPQESLNITAHNLTIQGGSRASAVTVAGLPLPYRVGDINLDMTGDIQLMNGSIFNSIDLGAVGDTGNINVVARSLSLTDGAQIGAIALGSGNVGSLNIHAHERVVLNNQMSRSLNPTGLYSLVGNLVSRQGSGQAGNVNITTGSLSVLNGAVIAASTFGKGNAGNIAIVADHVLVEGINDLQRLASNASGNGTSASLQGLVSNISSSVEATATGNGGRVDITAASLVLDRGGAIVGRTQGQGNAGSISVTVETLAARNGGQIVTVSDTAGKAGDIRLTASDRILLSGTDVTYGDRVAASALNRLGGASSGIYANTSPTSSGSGGNIAIRTGQLSLNDTAQLSVSSQGIGSAGSLAISAEQVRLNHSTIQAESREGDQGNVAIASSILLLRDRSQITTNATGRATGGNISLHTPLIVGLGNSDIVARATQGAGGKISIDTSGLFGIAYRPTLTAESDINASSDSGIDGTVAISNPNVDPQNSLVELPSSLVDSADELTAGCGAGQGQFVASGRGGLPISPASAVNENHPWQDLRLVASGSTQTSSQTPQQPNTASAPETEPPLQEAAAWSRNDSNEVVLLAAATNTSPSPQQQATCASL
jgi:filamentous hemagglutinin family protein